MQHSADRSAGNPPRLRGAGVLRHACFALIPLAALGLAGCLPVRSAQSFAEQTPEMRPETFFAGSLHSWGVLETRSGAPSATFRVDSHGETLADGDFRLDQTISFDGQPSRTRSWSLRRISAHGYTATLTDASGPVRGEAYGNLFHLTYPTKLPPGGSMEQWLYLQPDRRTVLNEATVRVAGLVVARLSERISRDEPSAGAAGR